MRGDSTPVAEGSPAQLKKSVAAKDLPWVLGKQAQQRAWGCGTERVLGCYRTPDIGTLSNDELHPIANIAFPLGPKCACLVIGKGGPRCKAYTFR